MGLGIEETGIEHIKANVNPIVSCADAPSIF